MKWYWIVLIAWFGPAIACYIFNYIDLKVEYYKLCRQYKQNLWSGEPNPVTIGDLMDGSFQFWIPIWNVVVMILMFFMLWNLPSWKQIRDKIYSIKI